MKKHLRREGSRGRRWRKREASKKITVPKGPFDVITPIGPVHTHDDTATIQNAHAVTAAIAARDEQEAQAVHEQLANAEADQASAEDELKTLESDQREAEERRKEIIEKVRKAGLSHMLVLHRAITLAVPRGARRDRLRDLLDGLADGAGERHRLRRERCARSVSGR